MREKQWFAVDWMWIDVGLVDWRVWIGLNFCASVGEIAYLVSGLLTRIRVIIVRIFMMLEEMIPLIYYTILTSAKPLESH